MPVYTLSLTITYLYSLSIVICVFKQKTAYEMRISDWSSDVCSSDLPRTLAMNQGSRVLLEQLGAWPAHSASIETVHVSQRGRLGRTLIRSEIGRASCRERVCQYV